MVGVWVCGQWAVEKGGEGEEAPITGAYGGIGSKGRAENFQGGGGDLHVITHFIFHFVTLNRVR